jgi:hypothetical protein
VRGSYGVGVGKTRLWWRGRPDWPGWSRPPGPATLAVAVAGLAVLVAHWCRWWPGDSPVPLLVQAAVVLALLRAGLVWALRTARVLGRDGRWSWWIAAVPAAVVVAAVTVQAERPQFEDARARFDAVAQRLLAEPGRTYDGGLQIGRFHVRYAYDNSLYEVYLHDEKDSNHDTGWVYTGGGPPRISGARFDPLERGWYRFHNISVDEYP